MRAAVARWQWSRRVIPRSRKPQFSVIKETARQATLGVVRAAVEGALGDLAARRRRDYGGAVLWQQGLRATEFFSRWVELKETSPVPQPRWEAPTASPEQP